MKQFDDFLSLENFHLAFERLKTAQKNLYKSIYYEDLRIFELFLTENIQTLTSDIKEGIYKPQKSHKIFIPKKDNLVRPLSMLTFIDLLVYQAITNIIADYSYDFICPYYEKIIFGNIVNTSTSNINDKKFFFKSWKKRWKIFNENSKKNHNNGYVYLSEFDIASFFDTIDHNILCDLLKTYKIEDKILDLLLNCLEVWTEDSNHKTFKSKHGIPQGPISSPFLADLYLFYLDKDILNLSKKLDFKYTRYVDDIRIQTKEYLTSQKLIAALDLTSRDLGLIPQGSKILIKKIQNIDEELRIQNSKFSDIIKEYKEVNENKPANRLKSKTHNKLKKRFINCFEERSDEKYLDKTIIGFSLYKLNEDDEVKNIILENYSKIMSQFEGILFYLKTHFSQDEKVLNFVQTIINDENILFNHIIALCFKYFPELPFNIEIYQRYTFEKHRHWLVNYYMINWLYQNDKKELILNSDFPNNQLLQRNLINYKFYCINDNDSRKILSLKLLQHNNDLISIQGLNLLFRTSFNLNDISNVNSLNHYIYYILQKQPTNIILHTLKEEWQIEEPESFFNTNIWTNEVEYNELKTNFLLVIKNSNNPSVSLMNLNNFNNMIFDKICENQNFTKVSKDFGVNLNANILKNDFPISNKNWIEINEKRNQKTEAHPYNKYGEIRIRIKKTELFEIIEKQKNSLAEICNFYHRNNTLLN